MKVVVVGRGRVGRGLFTVLAKDPRARHRLVSGRKPNLREIADADAVVLAVPDAAIAETAERIAPHLRRGAAVVHCAGARDATPLAPCSRAGAHVGVMHPMVSFPSTKRPPRLAGTVFVVAGDRRAIAAARSVAEPAGARVVVARVHGPAYHAAAALAANGAAAIAASAVGILARLGLGRPDAQRVIAGLLHTVADNVERIGVPDALTGPIRRGDADTVRAHRAALRALSGAALRAYDAVAPTILDTARAAGLSPARVRAIRAALR